MKCLNKYFSDTKESLLQTQQEIEKHRSNCEELDSASYLLQKKYASIQCEINMIREAAQNIIEHLKDIPNKNNNTVHSYKRKII